jgi:phage terminase large subunit-like protein
MTPSDIRSGAAWLASGTAARIEQFVGELTEPELRALPYLFDFWAHPHQLPPPGDWRTWALVGGRGAGKTRAGAEWVRAMVEGPGRTAPGRARRVALVGETIDQTREVMVLGESGILACCPPDRRPEWHAGRRVLIWPNGAEAAVLSAHEPDALRGRQFDAVWADEIAKWKSGPDAWEQLQLCLRLGTDPRACVTTTPRGAAVLKDLLAQPTTVVTRAPTQANRAYLADAFVAEVQRLFGGTTRGRQELDGEMLEDVEGALWTHGMIDGARIEDLPDLTRIVVAVDPPVSGKATSDACGIVVAGVRAEGPPEEWEAYVLEDATVQGVGPTEWARAAIAAMERHGADRMVAEVNQGGALVEAVVRQVNPGVSLKSVHATRGKVVRAEPVASLYEQGRVHHARGLGALEDQMCQMTQRGFQGRGSPDRVDALVWALTDILLDPIRQWREPRMRAI